MSNQMNEDPDVLARLVREAGDPKVLPDPRHAKTLRAMILDRAGLTQADPNVLTVHKSPEIPASNVRVQRMKRIANMAAAASILLAVGILVSWFVNVGGAGNLAFADVAEALDNVRTATYDSTMEMKNPMNALTTTTTMKCFFLAPSLERVEMSVSTTVGKAQANSILILDHQAMKGLTLAPKLKLATTIDLSTVEKRPGASNPFEMVRRLVREGTTISEEQVELLGKRVIDGRESVGFRIQSNVADQTFWADPQTARLVRVEMQFANGGGHGVMSNFRYDVDVDPSLFDLVPPSEYTVHNIDVKAPNEDDFVDALRLIAEHNDGTFPDAIGMNSKEFIHAMQEVAKLETEEYLKQPKTKKLREELKAQYGEDTDKFTQAWLKAMMPFTQKLTQKNMRGMTFYSVLTSANDSHYAGKGVKLSSSDRAIFWYKPTGVDNYRVIYADLSIRELTSDEVRKLSELTPK